jgi:glycosyltransferase involved in cell wall biosynthesis
VPLVQPQHPATPSLHIIHLASGREWRGGQRQVLLTVRGLAASGQVGQTVLTGDGTELARHLRVEGLPVAQTPWTIGIDPRVLGALVRLCRSLPPSTVASARPLIHAHDGHSVALAAGASMLCGAEFVATRRVDFPLQHRWPWRRARHIVAVSSAILEVLVLDGIPRERISVIYSGMSPTETAATIPLDLRALLRLPAQSLVAVNVAALVGHKDHATLLRAARQLAADFPTLHWVIAGDGERRRALERQISELELVGRVHLLGSIPDPAAVIAAGDLFVLSSSQEGLGTSILDAMALGVPVVATTAGGIPELITPGTGLLSPPRDSPALAESVRRVLQDTQLREALSVAGRRRAQEFTGERMAAGLLQVYRSVSQSLDGQ